MKTISCNIAIWPTAKIAQKAIRVSKKLKKNGTLFTLDRHGYYPHITVYVTKFAEKNFPAIEKKLAGISASFKPFDVNSADYRQSERGYVDVSFKRNKEITELQKAIVKSLYKFREEISSSEAEKSRGFPEWWRKNIRLYGYESIGKRYHPHITFTRLQKRKRHKDVISAMSEDDFSFKAGTIVFLKSGRHGVGRKILKIFRLKR